MTNAKACTRCKQTFTLEFFNRDASRKDGLFPQCKKCASDGKKIVYQSNKQKYIDKSREYAKANPEKRKVYRKKYIQNNAEVHREYQRIWAQNFRKANPGYHQRFKQKDGYLKEWRKQNPEKTRLQKLRRRAREHAGATYLVTDKELANLLLNNCFYCGNNGKMTIDHVIPVSRGGIHSVGNLVAACLSCNSSKKDKTISEWKLWMRKVKNV